MYASEKINCGNRTIWVDYDFDKAEPDINLGHRAHILKVEFNNRDVTTLVDINKVEDLVLSEFHSG